MSSRTLTTHTTSAPPRGSGFHAGTLIIAAISAVVAATVVSRLWQTGTVMATAMTPVLVTLVREALERPARRVSSIATRPRSAAAEPAPPPVVVTHDDGLTPMRVYGTERKVRRRWKLALATGLLAFLIAVAAMTLPELVAGRSVVSGSHHTTIFGGHRSTSSSTKTKTTDEKQQTTTEETTSTDTQPQGSTTQPDTTTTAPDGSTPAAPQGQSTTTAPAPSQQPAPTTPAPTQTAPPAQTQPPPTP